MNYQTKYYKYKEKYNNLKNILNKVGGEMKPYIWFPDIFLQKLDMNKLVKNILKICKKNKINPIKSSILDMGSGHGDISLGLTFYFNKVIGIDPSDLMLKRAEINKNRLKILKPDDFDEDKLTFMKNNFYNNLDIDPVNVIILSDSISYADFNTVNNVLDNLLNYLVKDGLIIIKDPWINAVFGNPKLNEDTDFRKEKIERIKKIRVEIDTFIENSDKVKLIESKEFKNKSSYLIILKKI